MKNFKLGFTYSIGKPDMDDIGYETKKEALESFKDDACNEEEYTPYEIVAIPLTKIKIETKVLEY